MKPNFLKRFRAMTMLVFASLLLIPNLANAQSSRDLAKYLSAQDNAIMGLNVDDLRKSKYFNQALEWAKGTPAGQELLTFLSDAGMDVSTDLNAILIGMANITPNATPGGETITVALAGNIDPEKVLKALADKNIKVNSAKDGKLTIHSKDDVDLVFPQKGVLWMTMGASNYRKGALQALKTEKKSVQGTTYFKTIIDGVNTNRSLWVLVEPSSSQPTGMPTSGPQAKSAGLSVGITNGFAIDALMELTKEEDAVAAAAELNAQLKELGSNPMVTMFAAGPLLSNLKITQKGTRLTGRTTMSSAEFDKMLLVGAQLIQAQLNNSNSATAPGAQPFPIGAPNTAKPDPKSSKPAPKKGVKADFN